MSCNCPNHHYQVQTPPHAPFCSNETFESLRGDEELEEGFSSKKVPTDCFWWAQDCWQYRGKLLKASLVLLCFHLFLWYLINSF